MLKSILVLVLAATTAALPVGGASHITLGGSCPGCALPQQSKPSQAVVDAAVFSLNGALSRVQSNSLRRGDLIQVRVSSEILFRHLAEIGAGEALKALLTNAEVREQILDHAPSDADSNALQNMLARQGVYLQRSQVQRILHRVSTRSQREAALRLIEEEGLSGIHTKTLQLLADLESRTISDNEVVPNLRLAACPPEDTLCNWLELAAAGHLLAAAVVAALCPLCLLVGSILAVYAAICNLAQ
jgi:hypothetical protein